MAKPLVTSSPDILSGTPVFAGTRVPVPPKHVERSTRMGGRPRKSTGPKGYVRELIDDGFFKKPKTIAEVKAELANRGHHIALTSLSGPLQTLCQDRLLRRHKAKLGDKAKKASFNYSEW